MNEQRKVLAIDGGGIKGVYPLAFLASIEAKTGARVADFFDLIVGTSTGGIIALGMGLGWSAQELLEIYKELGRRVFPNSRWSRFKRLLRSIAFSKYDSAPLERVLEENFGNQRLGQSEKRLVVPSANLEEGTVHLFKTAHHRRFREDYKKRVVDVAMSTAAAPTYFPTQFSSDGIPLIDGGVWANNPSAVAAVEALEILDWERGFVDLLSLSCTTEPFEGGWAKRVGLGAFYWSYKVKEVFMSTQASAAHGMTQHLLGKEHVVRIDSVVPQGVYGLDSVEGIHSLIVRGKTKARHQFPELREQFFESVTGSFEPFHSL